MYYLLAPILLCLGFLATTSTADCPLASLTTASNTYTEAQAAGDPATVQALGASTLTYTENFNPSTLATGILSQPLKLDHNRSTHDTVNCATFTELIVTNEAHPYVIASQLSFDNSTATPTLNKIETIITDSNDWLFNATGTLYWASRETWTPIPEAQRDTRATIQAAADAYCDLFNDKSVVVPWGTPCARLEGGAYTGTGSATDRCDVGVPDGVPITNRRYVIDESFGTVDVFNTFAGNVPDSHEFRIEGGKIRYVHTLSVTGT
ncbi:uncharacterized protein BCR38DRAFT_345425 [Pseudomassariella vexata]|uniref:DUF8021 domain-containing protein n=1 Tax=Pseudomassariella vexata TaxID=1141098 RepID=A0A1Y2DVK6_9PEZI|nr:uncharacterized protein BCR38DRAFT_345425 [Pseudomassariella vexata]ORY63283.1 hypothetical protein BCR38DRAFT_345425 [Pseudomassariella vexata]